MSEKLSEAELVERVERLMSGGWDEQEMKCLFREISENVPCPYSEVQGFIFHASDNPNAQTIVERMLAYRPRKLTN